MTNLAPKKSPNCYWCGKPATSREHVPPRNLFPQGKSLNLITVPSCVKHNAALTKVDEKFRVYLQALETSADALNEFKGRTYRGLTKPEAKGFVTGLAAGHRRVRVNGQPTIALKVDPQEQNLYFEKIIRGLYFHLCGKPAVGRITSASKDFIGSRLEYAKLKGIVVPFVNCHLARFGDTSNPDIFRFKYALVKDGERDYFAIAMLFYQGVEVLGLLALRADE